MADPGSNPFSWHPEPELIGFRDEAISRPALERLGAAAWEACLEYLYREALRRPIGPDSYPELRRRLFEDGAPEKAPAGPRSSADVLAEFSRRLAPFQYNSQHPRSFSYFTPPPLVLSIVGEVLAQWLNQGVDVWHAGPSSALVEEEVVGWLCEVAGYGPGAFGVLTSGGVMANIMGMTLARDVHLRGLLGGRVPRGRDLEGVRVYASDQAHFSIARALDILGFPPETLCLVEADADFRLRGGAVAAAVARDRALGLLPLAIAGVAGSTNTGSVDAVVELADVAETEGLWLHVDAAYGGAARLSTRLRDRVPGLERADSLTLDPHKWFFQALDIGGLLVKRRGDLPATFRRDPEYYRSGREGQEPLSWYQYSLEGTRRFRGLKLWLSWKHLGSEGLGRLVERNVDLAAYLARRCRESDDLETLPEEPELSVVCFRHLPGGREKALRLEPTALDRYQDRLQQALSVSGEAWVSTTRLRGRTFLRAGVINYMSTEDDVDRLLAALRTLSSTAVREASS
jgi:glutamate/tyrosine decarboxylase-like PLP-dependent enzyme